MSQVLRFSLTLGLLLSIVPQSSADVLAITHADFSNTSVVNNVWPPDVPNNIGLGANGFYYGYYGGVDNTGGAFTTGTSGAGLMQPGMDGPRPIWWADVGGTNAPSIVSFMQHPGSAGQPAVRRYVVGSAGEPAYTGTVRVVGRYYDLNGGSTKVLVAVDPDGDAGGLEREFRLPYAELVGPTPVAFDFTTSVSPGTTIDFAVFPNGAYNSDATGAVAWIVTEDVPVPTNVVATNYNSPQFSTGSGAQDTRGLIFALVTNGVATAADLDCFDTYPGSGHPYQFAGLLYSENPGSGKATRFDQVKLDIGTAFPDGGDFAELPRLFLLRHNSDPGSSNPVADERYALLPVIPVKSDNAAGRPAYTFDLTSLTASERTGYGFAVVGPGSGTNHFISVSEISATGTRVADTGVIAAQPYWVSYGGNRYALTLTRGTWEQCEAEAVSYGGHLVSINSANENDWVFETFSRSASTYIGLRQNPLQSNTEPRGGWTWMDGTVLNQANGDAVPGVYENWNDAEYGGSEPNHAYGAGEDYACFHPSVFSGRSTWGDIKNAGFPETSDYRGIIELPGTGGGVSTYLTSVPGTANIYGAGADLRTPPESTTPTVNGGGTGGSAPPYVSLPSGASAITFSSITGSVSYGGTGSLQNFPPDGTSTWSTTISPTAGFNGHAGLVNGYGGGFLVGVFVKEDGSVATLPPALDFSSGANRQDFTTLTPMLNQPFFIGDGLTGSGTGAMQQFFVPAGATRLYLGVADAYDGTPFQNAAGAGAYQDNSGAFEARLEIDSNPYFINSRFPASGTPLTLVGGQAPYDPVTISAGALPPGITINDKTVQGRATEEGQYTFTVRSQDAADVEATKSFTVNVAPAPGSMIAWWKGDQGGEDSAGTHHATFGGNANVVAGGFVGGKGFLFDGDDDYLTVPDASELNLTGDFTIETWVRLYSNVAQEPTIVSKRSSDGREVSYVLFVEADGRLTFASRALDSQTRDWVETSTPAGVTVGNDGLWTHVAVSCSGSTMKFYLNGNLVHTGTHPLRPTTTAPLTIGGGLIGGTLFGDWDGFIDELSIYDRALKASEISAIAGADNLGKVFRVKPVMTDETFPFAGGQLSLEGGTGPLVVSITDGTLPSGLSLSAGGLVTGTAANGPYNFTLRVAESGNHLNYTVRIFTGTLENAIPPPAGLAAWWPAQNTVADIIGGDHLSAPDNSPQYTAGKVGRAFSFNGTSQSLQTAPTDLMKHLPLTIEAWIKPEAHTTGNIVSYLPTNVIANDRQNFGGHGFGAHLYPDGSMLKVGIEGTTEDFRTVPNVTFTDGAWVHVAVVYTDGNVKTYVDGELKDSYDFEQGALNGGDIIRIGRHNDDTGYGSLRFFKGAIDEPSVYWAALSPEQVQALYLAGAGGKQRNDAGLEFFMGSTQEEVSLWTYGGIDTGDIDPSTFVLNETLVTAGSIRYWGDLAGGTVAINPTATALKELGAGGYYIHTLPNQIRQHPGGSGRPTVVRWTAPAAGRYAVCGSFTGLDEYGTSTDVHVYHNTLPMTQTNGDAANGIVNSEFMGNGHSFTGVIDAQTGHTVDFIIGPNGSPSFDSTGTFASVVYLGPSLIGPANLTIQTDPPPTTERVWIFETEFPTPGFVNPSLRVQYAEANTPDTWHDIDVEDGTNSMTPPEAGEDTWTLLASYFVVPAGNYKFRVVASATGYADSPGPAFGVEALGEPGTNPIAIGTPGEPPPDPPLTAMPAASKVTYSINGKTSPTTAKQGQVAKFTITQPLPPGTPNPDIVVQWSSTPADDQSWDSLDNQTLTYNKTTKLWTVSTPTLPAGPGIYFRTLTKGNGRLPAAGPIVSSVLKLLGPVNITPGPIWSFASVRCESSSDGSGKTATTGDTITYTLRFENNGAAPATDVLASLPVPAGTVLSGGTSADLTTVVTSQNINTIKKLTWSIPSLAPGVRVDKEIRVTVKDTTSADVVLLKTAVILKSDELAGPLNTSGNPNVVQTDIKTKIFSALRLTLTSSASPSSQTSAGVLSAGQPVYYTLTAENRSGKTLDNAVATLKVPLGLQLEAISYMNSVTGEFDRATQDPTIFTNPIVSPPGYQQQRSITWTIGTLLSTQTKVMKFTLRVMYDLQSYRVDNGVSITNTIAISDYNFTGKSGTKVLRAFTNNIPPVFFSLSDYPYLLRAPNLTLKKEAYADGKTSDTNLPVGPFLTTSVKGIGTVAAPLKGTRITYQLIWRNALYPASDPSDTRLPAEAKNVILRDEIPAGTTFMGFIRLNGVLLASDADFTFRDKAGKVIPSNSPRFTETRFIEVALGNLGAGAWGYLTYDVSATAAEGSPLISRAQGSLIPAPTAGSPKYEGYAIWCDNRLVGGVATPPLLTSYVVPPNSLVQTYIQPTNRSPKPGESVRLEIPYTVDGSTTAPIKDLTVTVTVPKPFTVPTNGHGQVDITQPLNATSRSLRAYQPGESHTITSRTNDTLVTFNLTSLPAGRKGVIATTVSLPSSIPATFRTAEGYIKDPVTIRAEIKGKRTLPKIADLNAVSADCVLCPMPLPAPSPVALAVAAAGAAAPVPEKPMGEVFVGRTFPFTVNPGDAFDMIVFFGNHSDTLVQGGKVGMPIPDGLTLESQTPVTYYYPGNTPSDDHIYERYNVATTKVFNGKKVFHIETLDLFPGSVAAVHLTFRVSPDFNGTTITDNFLCISTSNIYAKVAPPMHIRVPQRINGLLPPSSVTLAGMTPWLEGVMFNGTPALGNQTYRVGSRHINIANAEFLQLTNGSVVIRLPDGRSAVIGPDSLVNSAPGNIIADDGEVRIAVSHSSVSSVSISGITGTRFSGTRTFAPSALLSGLLVPNSVANMVAAGGGNLVAAGGGNLVAAGGLNLIGLDGGSLVPISPIASSMVAAGGGNMVAAGAGNIVAAGGLNLIGLDGGSLVAAGGLNLIGNDGGSLVAAGGGNMVAAGGGNLVAAGGLNLTATRIAQMIGLDGGSLTSVPVSGFGAGITLSGISAMKLGSQNAGFAAGLNGAAFIPK
ncbi:MAG: DUF11 domain-containing protein [Verrucomicrobiales bacterium]|nr:DUF11 domain-containing protein [Verrucomicrobiales bacterium]